MDFTAVHLLRPLLLATRDAGYVTEFACADGPGAQQLRDEGFRYRRIDAVRNGVFRNVAAIVSLAVSLRRDPVDIVHTHTPIGGLIGRSAAVLARTPRIVHTFHGLAYGSDRLHSAERVVLLAERVLALRTDVFFSQGRADADRAIRMGIARPGRLQVIGNGIDLSRFSPSSRTRELVREELGIDENVFVAVTVSRLIREKGILDLADAALSLADLPNLYFVIVGEALPSDRDQIVADLARHEVVRRLGKRWRTIGYRSDVARVLQASDLFVLPSYREGLPRSLIEAMACGIPAVMTNIPAGRELIEDGENGLLVPVGDSRALAAAIRGLVADDVRVRTMGVRARERALLEHDESAVLERELQAFSQLMSA